MEFVEKLIREIGEEINLNENQLNSQLEIFKENWIITKDDLSLLQDQDYEKLKIPLNLKIRIDRKLKKRVQIEQKSIQQVEPSKNISQIKHSYSFDLVQNTYTPKNLVQDDINGPLVKYNWVITSLFKHQNKGFEQYSVKQESQSVDQLQYAHQAFTQVKMPLSTNKDLKDRLIRFDKHYIRQGILLEVLDVMAAYVCWRFLKFDLVNFRMVTASIDHIQINQQIASDNDIILNGYPTFVGTSSIEIKVDFQQNGITKMSALAVFVSLGDKNGKKTPLPKLQICKDDPQSELLEELQKQGEINYKQRKLKKQSLKQLPHNMVDHHHEIVSFLNMYDINNKQKIKQTNVIDIFETLQVKTLVMHPQDKNLHMKIFGGYIMKEAYEIGMIAGFQVTRGKLPIIKNIEDIQFIFPVEIGSVMKFEGRVTCVYNNHAYIKVECIRVDYDPLTDQNQYKKTNDLKLIVDVGEDCKDVIPVTYEEVLEYIKSRNILIEKTGLKQNKE